MSLFDQNRWYQITIPTFDKLSMTGLQASAPNTAATVLFRNTNTSALSQHWQIFPTENSTYILRSQLSGPTAYLAVRANTTTESQNGGTTAIMRDVEAASDEVYWQFKTFSNGGFGLKNVANGTDWSLFVKDAGTMAMTNNVQGEQDNQSFNFTRLGKIDDQAYSTVQTPTLAPTSSPSHPIGSSTPPPSSNNGLSVGAQAAIGASIGGIVLIALIVGALFLLRRRRQKNAIEQSPIIGQTSETATAYEALKYGYDQSESGHYREQSDASAGPQELESGAAAVEVEGSRQVSELGGVERTKSPVELDGHQSAAR